MIDRPVDINFQFNDLLDSIQKEAFHYFTDLCNPQNGQIADSTWPGAPSSIAAVGFGLAVYLVGAERGWIKRKEAVERTLTTLRFFWNSPQGPEPDTSGYRGFYYHFLDLQTGLRTWNCELSTIDTAILLAGMLTAATYFDQDSAGESEIRQLAEGLYRRVDWQWAQSGSLLVSHGWHPDSGFLPYRWEGYDEAIPLYLLGLGSPDYPLPVESYPAYTQSFRWIEMYGQQYLYAGPLFIHHFPHVWIDFKGIQDEYMRARGINYFENSRRATHIHQRHAIQNPNGFAGYGENSWGITASEGPAEGSQSVQVGDHRFHGYLARGVPEPDDGTLSPWTAITSLPFAPEIALPAIQQFRETYPQLKGKYGLKCSLNPTYFGDKNQENGSSGGWFSQHYYGINEGPIALMVENYRTGLIWQLTRRSPYIVKGLRRAGFQNGWLTG